MTAGNACVTNRSFELRRAGRYLVASSRGRITCSARRCAMADGWSTSAGCSITRAAKERPIPIAIVLITEAGLEAYHDRVCVKLTLAADQTAVMGTAANMNYVGDRRARPTTMSSVTAAVTAGVEGNATAAGEPATWRETDAGMRRCPPTPAQSTPCCSSTVRSRLPRWRAWW